MKNQFTPLLNDSQIHRTCRNNARKYLKELMENGLIDIDSYGRPIVLQYRAIDNGKDDPQSLEVVVHKMQQPYIFSTSSNQRSVKKENSLIPVDTPGFWDYRESPQTKVGKRERTTQHEFDLSEGMEEIVRGIIK